jgi:coenzyme F420 hydrogenase subunit beta
VAVAAKQVRTIKPVVKSGLCTGCGTCVGICPQNAMEMIIDQDKGVYIPLVNEERCNDCGLCFRICPGHMVNFKHLSREFLGQDLLDNPLGNHLNCYSGYAADQEIRYNAASGGVVTALLISALEDGLIDGALVTKMKEDSPLEPQPFIARSKEDIISASKSKYCPVPANVALREIMEKEGRYAVVGLPCHIQGVRKASMVLGELRKRVVLCLSLLCGYCDTFQFTEFLLRKYCRGKGIKDVAYLGYRGPGWPGFLTVRFKDESEISVPFDEYIANHAIFFLHQRCLLCCDAVSRLSDITVMDAWLPEIMSKDTVGTSLLIARTRTGEELCDHTRTRRAIELKTVPDMDVIRSQGKERLLNRDLPVFLFLRKICGRSIPDYDLKLPRPGLLNWVRTLLIRGNIWISSYTCLNSLIDPLSHVERVISGAVNKKYVLNRLQKRKVSGSS